MPPIIRPVALAAVLSLAQGQVVAAQNTTQTASLPAPARDAQQLSLAGFATGLLRVGVSYARMLVDIRYGTMEADPRRGTIILRDLRVDGFGPAAGCHVTLGRLEMSGLSLLLRDRENQRIELSDLSIANNCFGSNAAMIGVATGGDTIPISSLIIDATAESSSGALLADIALTAPGIARIEASTDFDYFSWVAPELMRTILEGVNETGDAEQALWDDDDTDYTGDPDVEGMDGDSADGADMGADDSVGEARDDNAQEGPGWSDFGARGTLRAAHVTVTDLGLWNRVKPLLPPDALKPEAIDGSVVTAESGTPLLGLQQQLAGVIKAFIAQPGVITAEVRPAAPVTFDTTGWVGADDIVTAFAPRLTNAPAVPPAALIADPAAVPAGDARTLGLAFARGEGVPQNTRRAIELLLPLQDDGAVALALADLTTPTDPAAAYAHAQRAAAAGAAGALAALDRTEAALPTEALLAAQPGATTALPDTAFASLAALRDQALAYESGEGAPRSYALAWRLGALAAATGDIGARSLLERLDARFAGDAAWAAVRDVAADQAGADWTAQGLAARLAPPAAN